MKEVHPVDVLYSRQLFSTARSCETRSFQHVLEVFVSKIMQIKYVNCLCYAEDL